MNIRILTTLFNAYRYVRRCIESLQSQSMTVWQCHVIDDLSSDGSAAVVETLTKDDERFELIRNHRKWYQPGNYHQILCRKEVDDEDIIVMVDGDDWLPDPHVLNRVMEAYASGDVWLTWGSYVVWPSEGELAKRRGGPLTNGARNIRQHGWVTSHLKTCKAFLWRAIREEDLRSPTGQFWETAGDLAFMMPMIEMAGDQHVQFLPHINYVYNKENPIRDWVIQPERQMRYDQLIRAMPTYPLLDRSK